MAGTFTLRIVSPTGDVLKEDVEFVVLPGDSGELGILPNHAPLIAGLDIGVIRYTLDNRVKRVASAGGFAEIINNSVTVLADNAERSEEIDVPRARSAKDRAEKRLFDRSADMDMQRAEIALRKAVNRLNAAEDNR